MIRLIKMFLAMVIILLFKSCATYQPTPSFKEETEKDISTGYIRKDNKAEKDLDNKICETTKEDLKRMFLDCQSVKIADGREKGGERGMIILIHLKPDEREQVQLIVAFECSWQSEKNFKADLDYTNVVVGDSNGRTVGIFIAYMKDTKQYFESWMSNDDEYIKKWLVKLVNRKYFKKDALKYGW